MTRDTWPRWSACSIPPRKSPPDWSVDATAPAGGADAPAAAGRVRRPGAPAGRGLGAARLARVRRSRTRWCSTGRPARARRRSRGSPPSTPRAAFEELSAVNAGRAEVREVIARARERRGGPHGRATIFFLDEIHRFNKAQQDALLPAVEEGLLTLIGATTENPYFEVNSALLSRAQVYELQALDAGDLEALLRRALERGAGEGIEVPDEVITFLAVRSGGDARTALNALELAIATAQRAQEPRVTLGDAEDSLQRKAVLYDKAGDQHYDYISAWIKSTRGSDPDASLYYLAAMIEGGEDPRFIARRMIVLASEDIGNADPQALADRGRRRARGRARRLPRGRVRARPGGDLPLAGAEVRRRQARDRRGPRPHPRAGAKPPPARAALGRLPGGAQARAAGRATTTRTATPATSTTRSTCPRASRGCASTSPTRASRRRRARLAAIRKARGRGLRNTRAVRASGRACAHCCSPCSPPCCSPRRPRPPASSTAGADIDFTVSADRQRRRHRDRPRARRPQAADLHARRRAGPPFTAGTGCSLVEPGSCAAA